MPASTNLVELSVVITAGNRGERLRACLQALVHQTQPATDFEVIVVADAANHDTRKLLARFTPHYDLTVVDQEGWHPSAARNRGVYAARGSSVLFLDDNVRAQPTLVANHVRVQRSGSRVVGVGKGIVNSPLRADWFSSLLVTENLQPDDDEMTRCESRPTWADCDSPAISVERTAFLAVKGCAEDVPRGELIELGYRLMLSGALFVYVPGTVGQLTERKGVRQLARDYRADGAAYLKLAERHPPMLSALLGPVAEAFLRERILRQVIHFLRLPPGVLVWLGTLRRNPAWRTKWFRFLRRYFYWKGIRDGARGRDIWRLLMHGTPILMYHAFSERDRGSRFVIPIRRFAQQMRWIRRLGYKVIGLDELLRCLREHRLPPARSVVITIDDGYADNFEQAYPVLRRYRYPATVFVVSDRVGGTNTWSDGDCLAGRRLLSWQEIAQMARDGISFGAHTRTHPRLPQLRIDQAREEIILSREKIESQLEVPIRSFSYPHGECDESTKLIVEQSSMWGACGIEPGLNTPGTRVSTLHRVEIEGTLPLLRFLLALRTGHTELRIL